MTARGPVTFSLDADRVGWITFDDPAARANVLSASVLTALSAVLDAASAARPKAVVVLSAKADTFIAGADLKEVAALNDARVAADFSRSGQRLFARVAGFPVPVVAAMHGACAGGGFELALACHWRIATDAATTRIGLPEIGLGTIPGWGGGARLARLIGSSAALAHLLQARLLPASDAYRDGLVDELVAPAELRARARAAALEFAASGGAVRSRPPDALPAEFAELRAQTLAKTRGRVPAALAAVDLAEQTAALPLPDALEAEARAFGVVTTGAVCKNLLHAFSVREAARKQTLAGWFENRAGFRPRADHPTPTAGGAEPAPPPIARVGVVGAGVMGSGIAHALATHGCHVVLRDVQADRLTRGLAVIRRLFDEAVQRGPLSAAAADSGFARVRATTSWDDFAGCDLVVEAIVEDAAAKQALFRELARRVRPDALLASNTSALPIEEIAGHVPNPARTLGLHFFNPVSRMPLVELILSRHTSAATAERALALVKSLGKTPVVCRSSPGFLLTRVLFFYLNEAVRLWEDGVPTAELDAALRDFGWPMGPLRLIDEVGLDVTDFIFGELAHYFPERFTRTTACRVLLHAGLPGRKNGAGSGFYRYESRPESTNDAVTRRLVPASRPPAGAPGICHLLNDKPSGAGRGPHPGLCHLIDDQCAHLMGVMIAEARRCLAEGVVRSPGEIDFALLSGAGFPAFRGGLLRYAATLSPAHTPVPAIF